MDNHSLYNEKELLLKIAEGDEKAFAEIVHYFYRKTLPLTISLVKSETEAKDVMQEVFLKLWINRTTLSSIENLAAWINVVLANTTSNYIRTQLRYDLRIKKLGHEQLSSEEITGDIDARFTQSLIDEAVGHLPARRKQIFLLSRRDGLSRKEIAVQLNVSENTVRNQLSEAIQFIQQYLNQKSSFLLPVAVILKELLK